MSYIPYPSSKSLVPKTSKPVTPFKPNKKMLRFALRDKNTGHFYSTTTPSGYWGHANTPWTSVPTYYNNLSEINHVAQQFEVQRLAGAKAPEVEIITLKYQIETEKTEAPQVSPEAIVAYRVNLKFGAEVAEAYRTGVRKKVNMSDLRFGVRRRGGKALMEEHFPETSFSSGFVTFFQTDDQLMIAKLILDDKFGTTFDLDECR